VPKGVLELYKNKKKKKYRKKPNAEPGFRIEHSTIKANNTWRGRRENHSLH
jgi:hypothetical protein